MTLSPEQAAAYADTLRAAIAQGALSVQKGDERIQFRSLAEMRSILADLENTAAPVAGQGLRRATPTYSRGL